MSSTNENIAEEIIDQGRPSLAFRADIDVAISEHKLALNDFSSLFPDSNIDSRDAWQSKGLSSEKAQQLLAKYGPNELTPPKQQSEIVRFLRQFLNLFMVLLNVAALLSIVLYAYDASDGSADIVNLYLAIILIIAVIITCTNLHSSKRFFLSISCSFYFNKKNKIRNVTLHK